MKKYFLRQLVLLLPVLLGVTLVTFLLLQLVAGDTVDLLQQSHGAVSASVKQQLRSQLGLDQPLPVQYVTWLLHLLTGDAGYSYISGQSVSSLLLSKLPSTIILTISALFLALLLAIPAGIISALQQNKFWDYLLQLLSFLGSSVPGFLLALFLLYFFSVRLQLTGVLPDSGFSSWLLPIITLAIPIAAKYSRYIRGEILREMQQPYVTGALLLGISKTTILRQYIFHTVGLNMITIIAMSAGSLLSGTVIIENIFMLDGIGRLALEAIIMKDFPVLQAYVIWSTCCYVLLNLLAESICGLLDPRHKIPTGEES